MNSSIAISTNKAAKKRGKLSSQERFAREWKRVKSLQAQNLRLQQEVATFAANVIVKIAPAELEFAQANYQLAQKLLRFAERKSLNRWQREELLQWVQQILVGLDDQPFAAGLDVEALYLQLAEHISALVDAQHAEQEPRDEEYERVQQEQNLAEAMDELLEELIEREDIDAEAHDAFASAEEASQQAQEQSLSQLLKNSSINKMFRQIASAIHPDRENDPHRKLRRNAQMAELVRARDDKDIPAIFNLYEECVGASPFEVIGDDLEKVITLLKRQAARLRSDKEDIIYANPLHGAVYQRFYHRSQKKVDQAVDSHISRVKKEAQAHVRASRCITTLGRLKAVLEDRAAYAEIARCRR